MISTRGEEPHVEGEAMLEWFRQECNEQPQCLSGLMRAYSNDREIRNALAIAYASIDEGAPLLWTGMGASLCSAMVGPPFLAASGKTSFSVDSGEWLHYGPGAQAKLAGHVFISASGESAEVVELLRRPNSSRTITICNDPDSSCWQLAQVRLPILAGIEKANASKTFTNSLVACLILGSELTKTNWLSAVGSVTDGFHSSWDSVVTRRKEMFEFCTGITSIDVIGRGFGLAGAMMGALCLREMTTIRASGHSGGGFRHGPLLDVDSSQLSIIHGTGATSGLARRLAEDCAARGGRVILVSDRVAKETSGIFPVVVSPLVQPWSALTAVLVPQALTLAFIERHGTHYTRITTAAE
jgi:glucosamine--fructose-6-phosphate aminotransferase (isomerizing)